MKIKITIENFTISTKLNKSILVRDLLRKIKTSHIINSNEDEFKLLDSSYKILEENEHLKVPEKLENKINENPNTAQNSFLINSKNNFNIPNNNNNNNNNKTNLLNNNNTLNPNSLETQEIPEAAEARFYLIKYTKLKNKKYSSIEDFKSNKTAHKNPQAQPQAQKQTQPQTEITDLIMKTTNAKSKIDLSKFKQHVERSSAERLNLLDELINSSLGNIMGEMPNAPQRGNISQGGAHNISQLLNILRPIIGNDVSEGEVTINSSSREYPGSIVISRAVGHNRAPVVPDDALVQSLMEMGFPEEQCRRALVLARNNVSRATDFLLSGEMDLLPNENQHQNNAQANSNANNNPNQSNQNNNNNNQVNEISDLSNQDDEYMQNDFIEGESLGDEEMSDIPENISSSINIQNLPNLEVFINNFLNNNQQEPQNSDSTNNRNNANNNNTSNSENNNNNSHNNTNNNNNSGNNQNS